VRPKALSISTVSSDIMKNMAHKEHRNNSSEEFGNFLIGEGVISSDDFERARHASSESGIPIHTAIENIGLVSEDLLTQLLMDFTGLEVISKEGFPEKAVLEEDLPYEFLQRNRIIPIKVDKEKVILVTSNPFDENIASVLSFQLEKKIHLLNAKSADIDWALNRLYAQNATAIQKEAKALSDQDVETLKILATEQPVIRFVHSVMSEAIDMQASDIHFEPSQYKLRVRYRVDGILIDSEKTTNLNVAAIISRIKIISQLDIAERRLPQDGRLRFNVKGTDIDLRVSTTPTFHGESVVLRILNRKHVELDLDSLGYDQNSTQSFEDLLTAPNGIILVTGPTGSGKTTTLYACLKLMNNGQRKIFTVEDPVEYQLSGTNQIPTQPTIGLDFARALRAILRQDPDIIMIGEIRDLETAEIAVQAALTGHLVFATLHTNSASAALTRLLDMGIKDYLLSATITGIIGQRLVRKLCIDCSKAADQTTEKLLENLFPHTKSYMGTKNLQSPVGCDICKQTGYKGRTSLAEILTSNDAIKRMITDDFDETNIENLARKSGMRTMLEVGLEKIMAGETTMEEVLRVTRSE